MHEGLCRWCSFSLEHLLPLYVQTSLTLTPQWFQFSTPDIISLGLVSYWRNDQPPTVAANTATSSFPSTLPHVALTDFVGPWCVLLLYPVCVLCLAPLAFGPPVLFIYIPVSKAWHQGFTIRWRMENTHGSKSALLTFQRWDRLPPPTRHSLDSAMHQ